MIYRPSPVTIGGILSPCQSAAGRESPVTLSEAKGLRSEASVWMGRQMLRFAQHDNPGEQTDPKLARRRDKRNNRKTVGAD
jgi:hypothetical protein